jgi:hypothetical protein
MQQFTIQELRRLLMAGRTLDECETIKDYFFNWVKEHTTTAFKVKFNNEDMTDAITDALSYAFKRDIVTRGMQMFEVKSLHLLHGACVFETRGHATFFYFSDLDRGMLIRGDGKDYWLAAFALGGGSSGFSNSIVGLEN